MSHVTIYSVAMGSDAHVSSKIYLKCMDGAAYHSAEEEMEQKLFLFPFLLQSVYTTEILLY